jgi:hypothetical protein
VEEVFQKDLPDVTTVAFTTDGWTSRQNDPYQSLTVHYISKEFELKRYISILRYLFLSLSLSLFSRHLHVICTLFGCYLQVIFLLACYLGYFLQHYFHVFRYVTGIRNFVGRHTGQQVASLVDSMVDSIPELRPECSKVAVTDAGSNMLLAMKLSKHMDSNLRCVDHILNTAIQTAWRAESDTRVSKILKMCTDLCTYVHRSSLAAGHIKQVIIQSLFDVIFCYLPVSLRYLAAY